MALQLINLGNPTPGPGQAGGDSRYEASNKTNNNVAEIGTRLGSLESGTIAVSYQTAASYALILADAGKVVEMDNAGANTLTVPLNSAAAFPIGTLIQVDQVGTGQTTIAAAVGVTLRPGGALTIRTQWSSAALRKRGTDEWVVSGDLT